MTLDEIYAEIDWLREQRRAICDRIDLWQARGCALVEEQDLPPTRDTADKLGLPPKWWNRGDFVVLEAAEAHILDEMAKGKRFGDLEDGSRWHERRPGTGVVILENAGFRMELGMNAVRDLHAALALARSEP